MAVNLCIVDPDRDWSDPTRDFPGWDPHINGGHKAFAREVLDQTRTPYVSKPNPTEDRWSDRYDDRWYIRPTDFPAWRAAVQGLPNLDLFLGMIDILEENPTYWLYISQ
uniref:Uncharacterized protein n=1 Tax=Caulobacter phage BL57 TaxID=3348355 RepID=A0AB74UN45_9VIRU